MQLRKTLNCLGFMYTTLIGFELCSYDKILYGDGFLPAQAQRITFLEFSRYWILPTMLINSLHRLGIKSTFMGKDGLMNTYATGGQK